MKLNITLCLALAGACSAFALTPGTSTRGCGASSVMIPHNKPSAAFVQYPQPTSSNTALSDAAASTAASSNEAINTRGGGAGGIDFALMTYFALWYLGNYYYNITNKLALKATGGAAGFPMTISALQLGIGSLYGIFLWLAPDAREKPKVTMDDIIKMLPVAFCYAGAHSASVFSFSAGSVSFGQIVKVTLEENLVSQLLVRYVFKLAQLNLVFISHLSCA